MGLVCRAAVAVLVLPGVTGGWASAVSAAQTRPGTVASGPEATVPASSGCRADTPSLVACVVPAQAGDAAAQHVLGAMYVSGSGVRRDDARAVEWFRKSAEQGYAPAQRDLGLMYAGGRGVPRDHVQAFTWIRKAADQGYAPAQFNIGISYRNGEGVAQDDAQAAEWFRRAAEQGDADAHGALGWIHHEGRGVPQDGISALEWSRRGANRGSVQAFYNLGTMYDNAGSVPRDAARACLWFGLAVEAASAAAAARVDSFVLSRNAACLLLTPEQRAAVEAETTRCRNSGLTDCGDRLPAPPSTATVESASRSSGQSGTRTLTFRRLTKRAVVTKADDLVDSWRRVITAGRGKAASTLVEHSHVGEFVQYCRGTLETKDNRLLFRSQNGSELFEIPLTDLVAVEKRPQFGTFDVTVRSGRLSQPAGRR